MTSLDRSRVFLPCPIPSLLSLFIFQQPTFRLYILASVLVFKNLMRNENANVKENVCNQQFPAVVRLGSGRKMSQSKRDSYMHTMCAPSMNCDFIQVAGLPFLQGADVTPVTLRGSHSVKHPAALFLDGFSGTRIENYPMLYVAVANMKARPSNLAFWCRSFK